MRQVKILFLLVGLSISGWGHGDENPRKKARLTELIE